MPAMVRVPALDGLPPVDTKRWVARRKAAVLAAVRRGLITQEEVCRRYELSEEEFSSWQQITRPRARRIGTGLSRALCLSFD